MTEESFGKSSYVFFILADDSGTISLFCWGFFSDYSSLFTLSINHLFVYSQLQVGFYTSLFVCEYIIFEIIYFVFFKFNLLKT